MGSADLTVEADDILSLSEHTWVKTGRAQTRVSAVQTPGALLSGTLWPAVTPESLRFPRLCGARRFMLLMAYRWRLSVPEKRITPQWSVSIVSSIRIDLPVKLMLALASIHVPQGESFPRVAPAGGVVTTPASLMVPVMEGVSIPSPMPKKTPPMVTRLPDCVTCIRSIPELDITPWERADMVTSPM